jgi:two-component system cell cycle response regulator
VRLKVLVADDEPVSRRLLEASLKRWGYTVVTANDGCEASRILRLPDGPKLVVFDWLMPGLDGIQLCRDVRAREQEPYTYVLLLTSKREQGDVVEGLSAGADDYITKPFDPEELQVRMRAGKRILCLQDQLIAAREALRDMALHDALTRLWNRAAIHDILRTEIARCQRESASLGVILVDLDHFKVVNDTYGHQMGDEALRETARTLRESTRPYDAVGRIGGEEFLLVLPGCDQMNAASHAERLRVSIERLSMDVPGGALRITASLGVTVFRDGSASDSDSLVQAADEALYRAKREGRNRVEVSRAREDAPAAKRRDAAALCAAPAE